MQSIGRFEKIVAIIFIFTLVSGALRKWIFADDIIGNYILLIQLASPFFLLFCGPRYSKPWEFSLIFLFIIFLLFLVINPLNLTYFHGFLGFFLHFGFWFSIAYYFINKSQINLRPLLPLFFLGIFIELILAFVQYNLPSEHILNNYANIKELGGNGISLVGNRVRVTGTFSYLAGYSSFITFLIFFIWYLIRINYKQILILLVLFLTLVVCFMSGSRLAFYQIIIVCISIYYSSIGINKLYYILINLILLVSFFYFISYFIGNIGIEDTIQQAFENFIDRVDQNKDSGEQNQRILWDLQDLINFKGNYPLLGVGLGSTYQGATSVFGTSDYVKEYGYYENELTRIVLEGGFALLFFRFILFSWLFYNLKIHFISKLILFVFLFYGSSIVFNIYNGVFLFLGIILLDNSFSSTEFSNNETT